MAEIRIDRDEAIASIATVTLSNPTKLNAINVAMWESLARAFTVLSEDDSLRCIIVRGDGHNFAAGADVEEFSTVRNSLANGMRYHTETIGQTLRAIAECRHPTVAAIEGVCVGGGLEIACACDIRVAASNARFGIPVNRLGFPLAPDELAFLLQLVGKAIALEMLLEGRVFDAVEAKDKGLVHRVVADVSDEAQKTAVRITQGAPLAARANKQLIRRLTAEPRPLDEQERQDAFSWLASQDYREGVQTFLAKRKPVFSGK